MDKELKGSLLSLLEEQAIAETIAALDQAIAERHPAKRRTTQLAKRFKELTGRKEQGTLSPADIDRVNRRITGGLREIILDYKAMPVVEEKQSEPQVSFTLDLAKEQPEKEAADAGPTGFKGAPEYQGSPSKKSETLTLNKSYGAAFHVSVQAIRKCGMEMIKGDRAKGTIEATAPGNTVARFGEIIFLWLTALPGGKTKVFVVVDSANPETVFDLGRNQQKLQALTHQIRNA